MKVPSPGKSITEVEIAHWLVKTGDYVERDQAIAEVDSNKATLELPAETADVTTLQAEEGEAVKVGQMVCLIDTAVPKPAGGQTSEIKVEIPKQGVLKPAPAPAPTTSTPVVPSYAAQAPSPAACKILAEREIPAAAISDTGKGGRITKDDALKASKPSMGIPTGGVRIEMRAKMSMLRRKVAERLVGAKNKTAMLITFNEADMTIIYDLRAQYKDAFKERHNVGLGFMSFFTLAVVRVLKFFPDVDSMIDGQDKVTYQYYGISIAVSGPKGLVISVIRNAENLSFRGVEAEVKHLATHARDGQITVDEMAGGTFTITNEGMFGSMLLTPTINLPQSGMLGMHNIVDRPIVRNGRIVIVPVMYIALSYDHRIIDGRESIEFLVAVKEALENPVELLMNGDVRAALELQIEFRIIEKAVFVKDITFLCIIV